MGRYGTRARVRYAPHPPPEPVPSTTLARRFSIADFVQAFAEAEVEVRDIFARAVAVENRLSAIIALGERNRRVNLKTGCFHIPDWSKPDPTLEELRKDGWRALADRLELRSVMSVADEAKLERMLDRGPWPELTAENVRAFLDPYLDFAATFERLIVEVFDWLRPASRSKWTLGRYKTNQLDVVGEEVILSVLETGKKKVASACSQNLIALERVFRVLDGKGHCGRGYYSDLELAIQEKDVGQTEFFSFRCFFNGHVRLRFLRKDILAAFNRRAGAALLRQAPEQEEGAGGDVGGSDP